MKNAALVSTFHCGAIDPSRTHSDRWRRKTIGQFVWWLGKVITPSLELKDGLVLMKGNPFAFAEYGEYRFLPSRLRIICQGYHRGQQYHFGEVGRAIIDGRSESSSVGRTCGVTQSHRPETEYSMRGTLPKP